MSLRNYLLIHRIRTNVPSNEAYLSCKTARICQENKKKVYGHNIRKPLDFLVGREGIEPSTY